MVNQGCIEHARQRVDLFDMREDVALVLGLQHHHQLALRAFLVQFDAVELAQVGLHRAKQFGAYVYQQAGDMQGAAMFRGSVW